MAWGKYSVNEKKGKENGGEERSEAVGELCCCFAGRFSVKIVCLVNSWYQERRRGIKSDERGQEAVEEESVKR